MKNAFEMRIIVPALMLGMVVAAPAFAQENSGSASHSMRLAGESAENAASETGQAIKNTYHSAATALSDTAITARVKTALHENKITTGRDIHVTTVAGVVSLKGTVPSAEMSETAQQIAKQTIGVKEVTNDLTTEPTAAQ